MLKPKQHPPKLYNGWIHASCKGHALISRKRVGEGASADLEAAAKAREKMLGLLMELGYKCAKDLYNCDETALYPMAQLDRIYSFTPRKGFKKKTKRVTMMLCASADEFDREKLVISKAACPRNFKEKDGYDPRDRDVYYYYYNFNTWIMCRVLNSCLLGFNDRMRRKIDNTSTHGIKGYQEEVADPFKLEQCDYGEIATQHHFRDPAYGSRNYHKLQDAI